MLTPTALASEARRYEGTVWRVVEAQHRISTNRLAASLEDQARLEALGRSRKTRLAQGGTGTSLSSVIAVSLWPPHRLAGSAVPNERPGIFYASEAESTAIAETAYWRLRFFLRSPGFVPPSTTTEHSSFTVKVRTESRD
jgi:hypothetical protein